MKTTNEILKKAWRLMLVAMLTVPLSSCWEDDQLPADDPTPPTTGDISLVQDGQTHSLSYNGYTPLQAKPVGVYYYIPKSGSMTTMPILFVMPGEERDADSHIALFTTWAEQHRVMVFAVSYSKEYYTSTTEYILGGMNTRQSADGLLPREQWNFNYIESLFDAIKAATGNTQTTYDLWGHSAGAQFVHRFATFMPQARIRRAVACNSGWYTVADNGVTFPYGLSPVEGAGTLLQQTLFARSLYVCVGSLDTSTAGLNDNEGSKAQGENRNERGKYYYETSKKLAESLGFNFNWTLLEVNGVAHDAAGMANGTMNLLN